MEIAFIPEFLFCNLKISVSGKYHLNILISNIILVAIFSTISITQFNTLPHLCISKYLFNTDCPGCGITTGLFEFFHFKLRTAYISNPVSIVIGLFIITQVIIRIIVLYKRKYATTIIRHSALMSRSIILLLLLNYIIKIFLNL